MSYPKVDTEEARETLRRAFPGLFEQKGERWTWLCIEKIARRAGERTIAANSITRAYRFRPDAKRVASNYIP